MNYLIIFVSVLAIVKCIPEDLPEEPPGNVPLSPGKNDVITTPESVHPVTDSKTDIPSATSVPTSETTPGKPVDNPTLPQTTEPVTPGTTASKIDTASTTVVPPETNKISKTTILKNSVACLTKYINQALKNRDNLDDASTNCIPDTECSSYSNVKEHLSNNWNNTNRPRTEGVIRGQETRLRLLDEVLQETKLAEFQIEDLKFIKSVSKIIMPQCVLKYTSPANDAFFYRKIAHTLSRSKQYTRTVATCDLSVKIHDCILEHCKERPLLNKTFGDIRKVAFRLCNDVFNPAPLVAKTEGLSPAAVFFIVLACIFGAGVVAFFIGKHFNIRRSDITSMFRRAKYSNSNLAECEMTMRSRPAE